MTNQELLELAAKAVGLRIKFSDAGDPWLQNGINTRIWNPLVDSCDALELAVNLGISITPYPVYQENGRHSVVVKQRRGTDTLRHKNPTEIVEQYDDNKLAATRLAIVRCAAEIAKDVFVSQPDKLSH